MASAPAGRPRGGAPPVSVVVPDAGGHGVAPGRDDGSTGRSVIASGGAHGALAPGPES